jgi:hypothetical protein
VRVVVSGESAGVIAPCTSGLYLDIKVYSVPGVVKKNSSAGRRGGRAPAWAESRRPIRGSLGSGPVGELALGG